MLVGVSDEGSATLKKWAEQRGVQYPVVNAPKGIAAYAIEGYPTVFSIDAAGRIAQRGQLTTSQIEERLQQVRWLPDLGASPTLVQIKRLWEEGKFADLDRKLRSTENDAKADAADRAGATRVRGIFDKLRAGTAKEIEGLKLGPDYLLAEDRLREIEKHWRGYDLADVAKAMQSDFKKDARVRKELEASKKLRETLARTGDDQKARVAALQALVKRHPGTFAASQAQDLLRER